MPSHRWLLDEARAITVAQPAGVMGIINATPDSFSDGGMTADPETAARAALAMVRAGADWIDVGGESTRPGAPPVSAEEESARVVPAIRALRAAGVRLPISVDTSKGSVAEAALAAGADAVNDVTGGADPRLLAACAAARCPLVIMHMRGTPTDMQRQPRYGDVVSEVTAFLAERLSTAERAGVQRNAVLLDPGIGFGKTTEHNLALLQALPRIATATGRPLVVGISRKSLLATVGGLDAPPGSARDGASQALHVLLAEQCVLLRTHDVPGTRAALRLRTALREAA